MIKKISSNATKIQVKKTFFAVALVLMMVISLMQCISISNAVISVVASVSTQPKVSAINTAIGVTAFITPPPEVGNRYSEIYLVFTKPSGTTETLGPITSNLDGTVYTLYTPNELGNWRVKLTWAGDATRSGTESESYTFIVQQEPLPVIAPVELPSGYWARPINGENREWASISGGWYMSSAIGSYNGSKTGFNPYSKAPNTAHILWTLQATIGGLVGGDFGGQYFQGQYTFSAFTVIMAGRAYYMATDGIHCVDLRTGEEMWNPAKDAGAANGGSGVLHAVPGPVNYPGKLRAPQVMTRPYLWTHSALELRQYDAATGAVLLTVTTTSDRRFGTTYWDTKENVAYTYMTTINASGTTYQIVKWDTLTWTTNFTARIIWAVPAPGTQIGMNAFYLSGAQVFFFNGNRTTTGYNAATGALLWNVTRDYFINSIGTVAYGKAYYPSSTDRRMHAYSLTTGEEVWTSDQADYPWGSFWAYSMGAAYGKIFGLSYDGHLYAYNAETGNIDWKFYSGDTTETPYGTWAFWGTPAIADGKIYAGTSEHSPTAPQQRGSKLYCIDVNTGTEIWNITFLCGGGKAIADGALVATSEYDQVTYCFDKGKTAVTLEVSPKVAIEDSSVLIEGTITDQSPAQLGTGVIADEYMSTWMEYLHMQKPKPANATGIPLYLTAIDSAGNSQDIGAVTSDTDGNYAISWTPSNPGLYQIIATFKGTESYYNSYSVTNIVVSEASTITTPTGTVAPTATVSASPTVAPTPGTGVSTETLLIASASIVIIIAVIAAALVLRKRK